MLQVLAPNVPEVLEAHYAVKTHPQPCHHISQCPSPPRAAKPHSRSATAVCSAGAGVAGFQVPMAGGVLLTLNTRLEAATVAYMLDHSEAKVPGDRR